MLKYIKTTRLTIKTYCPSLTQQAEKLYKIASEHVGEDLSVTLQCKHGRHATYLSIQDDQKIRYADSNHGVFLFDNKEQFISAYKLMNQYDNQQLPDYAFTFFSVSQLKEDKNNELTESNTLTGKWRSLLTGRKYKSDSVISQPELAIPISFGALAGGAIGVVVGVAIVGLDPIGGLTIASIGGLAALDLVKTAQNNNHFGLLGPYHYLREKLHAPPENVKANVMRDITGLIAVPVEGKSDTHTLSYVEHNRAFI